MLFSNEMRLHKRRSFSLLDLFGEFGGVLEVGTILFTCYLGGWAEFSYYLKAIQKLYDVKSKHTHQFVGDSDKFRARKNQLKKSLKTADQVSKVDQIRSGKINTAVQLGIFAKWMTGCLADEASDLRDAASRFFVMGLSRFEEELNIDKILWTLRNVKSQVLTKQKEAMLAIDTNNIIEVDSDDIAEAENAKKPKINRSPSPLTDIDASWGMVPETESGNPMNRNSTEKKQETPPWAQNANER